MSRSQAMGELAPSPRGSGPTCVSLSASHPKRACKEIKKPRELTSVVYFPHLFGKVYLWWHRDAVHHPRNTPSTRPSGVEEKTSQLGRLVLRRYAAHTDRNAFAIRLIPVQRNREPGTLYIGTFRHFDITTLGAVAPVKRWYSPRRRILRRKPSIVDARCRA